MAEVAVIRSRGGRFSTHQGSLKPQLETFRRAGVGREDTAEVFQSLPERIGRPTAGRRFQRMQGGSQFVQSPTKPLHKVIERVQRQGNAGGFPRSLDREPRQPFTERRPEQGSGEGVARQDLAEEDREGSTAAAPVRAEHSLSPVHRSVRHARIVAPNAAVAVERAGLLAEGTGALFEASKKLLKRLGIQYKDRACDWHTESANDMSTVSRNDPCPCGSGKKYKKCCLNKKESAVRPPAPPPRVVETDLDELSNCANDMIRAKRWDEAERLCLRLKKEFPEELDADDRLAQLYQAQENYAQALPYALAALDKARRNPDKFDPELAADLEEQVAFIQKKVGS